jgi:ABC-type enterochelin transport system substrate-binding protein
VRGMITIKPRASTALAAIALGAAVLLGGCSSRDTVLSEKLAAADAAAARAERAAVRAEEALAKVQKANEPAVVDADPNEADDDEAKAVADQNEPPPNEPDKG